MKRLLFYMLFSCFPLGLMAEDLQFVTTLSSPVGTFSQLETADPETAVVSPAVNFCTTHSSTGRMELRGANAYLQSLTLKNGTSLGGTVGEYRLSSALNVNSGGTLKAKRIMANTMSLSGAIDINSQVNNTLYMSSMGVKGAKTGSLMIPSKVQTSNTGNNDEMEWSNIYSRDYTSGGSATGNSYTSYLLKSIPVADCNDPSYSQANPDECCREYDFFAQNKQFCCVSVNEITLDFYFNEDFEWYDCCRYSSSFNKKAERCCQDGTAPDYEKDCYTETYDWVPFHQEFTISSYTTPDDPYGEQNPCWDRYPASEYRPCTFSCNKNTVGEVCWENNGDPLSCGLETTVEYAPGVAGEGFYTFRGNPLERCERELTPIYW